MYFALDSRFFPNPDMFYESGEPFTQALWSLSISTNGVLNSNTDNDLDVEFQVNPLARSLGVLNPSMSDSQISADVRVAFQVSNGTATLTDYELFPTGTIYTVDREIRLVD